MRASSYTLTPPARPISATVQIPGSKSYTNRALLIASLANGISRVTNASVSNDCLAMIDALRKLGVSIHSSQGQDGIATLIVEGRGGQFLPYQGEIDVGPAGTTMRFLVSLLAASPGVQVTVKGSERMHERPIRDLVEALRELGASIDYLGKDGCPPLLIRGRELRGGKVSIPGGTSSQFISSLLMVAPLFPSGIDLTVDGELTSQSYIEMTLQSMREFNARVDHLPPNKYLVVPHNRYQGRSYEVEADLSGASYFFGLAALGCGTITVGPINSGSAQGDLHFPVLLEQMGCTVRRDMHSITVTGAETLRPISCDMKLMPDTAQTLAVVAAVAKGETIIRGLSTLKAKETDRLEAVKQELTNVGIGATITEDSISVKGGIPHGGRIATYDDHRMAMSFAMLGAKISGVEIRDPHVVEKSFPTFWTLLGSLGIGVVPCVSSS